MSAHHRTPQWLALSARLRPVLQAQINQGGMPCIDARAGHCGGWVVAGDRWDVAHIIPLNRGGTDEPSNLGVSHVHCNRKAGGTDGARIANARRAERGRLFKW